ncbi:MAG: sortase [Minisyncoccia bacterium]
MSSFKRFKYELKLFLGIFTAIFLVVFFIFDGTAFGSILAYKIHHFFLVVQKEATKPVTLIPESQSSSSTTEKIILPTLPEEALNNNLLELPEFGIKAPIWKVDTPDLKLIYAKLKEGVVLYPGSAIPGQGYAIIIGHSSQYPWQPGRYKAVFSLLSQLEIGDKIFVYWNKKPLVFEVQDKKIFLPWPKGNELTETIFPPENKPILILQSCWPAGVAYKRVAIKALLVSSN